MSDHNPTELARYFSQSADHQGLFDQAEFWRTIADAFLSGQGVPDSHLETAIGELMRMIEMCELASFSEDDLIMDSMDIEKKKARRLIDLLELQRYEKPETQQGSSIQGKKLDRLLKE